MNLAITYFLNKYKILDMKGKKGLIIGLHDSNSSMKESQTFRKISTWFIHMRYKER